MSLHLRSQDTDESLPAHCQQRPFLSKSTWPSFELVALTLYQAICTEKVIGIMQLGGNMKPSRIRVLDLPFTAVEWVLPEEISPAQYLGQEKWIVWERSPLARERSLFGYWDDTDDGQLAAAAQDGAAQGGDTGHPSSSGNTPVESIWKQASQHS